MIESTQELNEFNGYNFGQLKSCENLSDMRLIGLRVNDESFEGIDRFAPNLKKLSIGSVF
jgi:hypothetical protein